MANELTTLSPEDEQPLEPVEDLTSPGVIHLLASDYVDLPHDEAIENLSNDYSSFSWEDQEKAAREFSTAVDRIHRYHEVVPESDLAESFAGTVKYILNEHISEDDRLDKIDEDVERVKNSIYSNAKDPGSLLNAKQKERELDAIRLQLRRTIIAKDTGRAMDMLARGANSAFAPLAGASDIIFGTELRDSLRETTMEITRPDLDDSWFSVLSSGTGSVVGTAAAGLTGGPAGAYGYLGAMMASEVNEVYDTVLKETEDKDAAERAAVESVPGSLLGAFGDRLTGGWLAKLAKGKGIGVGAAQGFIKGGLVEGVTETAQELITSRALTKYSENPMYTPTEMELFKVFTASATIGGAIGGIGGLRTAQLERAKEITEKIIKNEPVEINGETIEDPQGFLNTMKQKAARFEILKKQAKDEGKTVEEVVAEERAREGVDVLGQAAERFMAKHGIDSEARTVTTEGNVTRVSYRDKPKEISDTGIKGTLEEPRDLSQEEQQKWENLNYSVQDVYEATKYMTPEELSKWEARQAIGQIFGGKIDVEAFKESKKRFQLWKAAGPNKRPFNSSWYPNEEELFYIMQNSPEVFGEDVLAVTAPEIKMQQVTSETAEAAPEAEPEVEIAPPRFRKDFGFAWPESESAPSYAFGNYIANEMGVELVAEILDKGTLGLFSAKSAADPGKMSFIRELFRNPKAFLNVFWHEFTHSISKVADVEEGIIEDPLTVAEIESHKFNPAYSKFVRIYQDFKALGLEEEKDEFTIEVDALDMSYVPYTRKPGTKFTEYRESGEEQFANAMSAILTDPERVRDEFPTVWKVFKKAVDAHPRLKELVTLVDKAKTDPTVLAGVYTKVKEVGQNAEGKIVKEATQRKFDERKARLLALPKEAVKEFGAHLVSRWQAAKFARDPIVEAGLMTKEEFYKNFALLQAASRAYMKMEQIVDKPINQMIDKFLSSVHEEPDVAIRNLANFMDINHVLNDTNETVDEIITNPNSYQKAAEYIGQIIKQPTWYNDRIEGREGEDLVRALSAALIEFDPETVENLREYLAAKMAEASNELFKGALSGEQMEELTNTFLNSYYGMKMLQDDAFNVRRLMANYAIDGGSAAALMDSMKRRVGYSPETGEMGDWQHYDTAIKELHKLGHRVINDMDTAGLLDAPTRDKLKRNVESYSPQNVIKYFEKDPRIPASIRKAYGALDVTGNSLTSYIGKMKALMLRAAFQRSQNAAAEIAKAASTAAGITYREVEPKKHFGKKKGKTKIYYDSVFDTRVLMQEKNPNKSYFITADEGRLTLFEFDDPKWNEMFSEDGFYKQKYTALALELADGWNKATAAHWTKTLASIPFRWRSRASDIKREATLAGSFEVNPFLFWHTSKKLSKMRKEAYKDIQAFMEGKAISPELQEALEHDAIMDMLTSEYGGISDKEQVQHRIYDLLGESIPSMEDESIPTWLNKKEIEIIRKIPFIKSNEDAIRLDELVTKFMGYKISRNMLDKGPEEAAYVSRNWVGTPDPTVSGINMGSVNKLFLFQRAGIGGTRALVEMAKDPSVKFWSEFTYRTVVPRLLVSGAIAGPIVGAIFGDESEKVYRKFCNKLSSYQKIGKFVIGLGFKDTDGNFRPITEVNSNEITSSWKSVAITIPQERGFITLNQATTPFVNFLEDLLDTGTISGRRIAEDARTAFSQVLGSNLSPGAQTAWHLGLSEAFGTPSIWSGNPQDYFRNKGIISKDVAAANDIFKKFAEYTIWSLYNTYPAMLGVLKPDTRSVSEPTTLYDMVAKTPALGSVLTAFTTVTNYGDIENTKEDQAMREQLTASVKLSMGEDTRTLIREASRHSGIMSGYGRAGKKWKEEVDPKVRRDIEIVNQWRGEHYNKAIQEMRDARSAGDYEKEKAIRDTLERNAARVLKKITR